VATAGGKVREAKRRSSVSKNSAAVAAADAHRRTSLEK